MKSITRGDLGCLELMLAATDLLSHHMRILLPDQWGPHKVQAKYYPFFGWACGGGASGSGTIHQPPYPREQEVSVYSWSSGGEVAWVSKKGDTPFQLWRKRCDIVVFLRKPELRRMCQWGNLIPFVR